MIMCKEKLCKEIQSMTVILKWTFKGKNLATKFINHFVSRASLTKVARSWPLHIYFKITAVTFNHL